MKTYERGAGEGGELVLRGDGEHFEIISNGMFLMDTRAGESERLLVRAALERTGRPSHVLIGGLGVGFSVAEALRHPHTSAVTVIEREPAVIGWHATHLRAFSAGALEDPRVRVERADLLVWLAATTDRYDALCLDIDNGPEWTVTDGNAALYGPAGLELMAAPAGAGRRARGVERGRRAGLRGAAARTVRRRDRAAGTRRARRTRPGLPGLGVVLAQLVGAVLRPGADGDAAQVVGEDLQVGVPGRE